MIEHLVLFKFMVGVKEEQKQELVNRFYSLSGKIEGLKSLSVGLNKTVEKEHAHYEFGMRMLFQNQDSLATYQVHPNHLSVIELVKKIVYEVAVVNFELFNQS